MTQRARGPVVFDRRAMLSGCLGMIGLCRRSAWASKSRGTQSRGLDNSVRSTQYRSLSGSVVVPLTEVGAPWRPVWFEALAPALDPTSGGGPDVLLEGVLLRLPEATDAPPAAAPEASAFGVAPLDADPSRTAAYGAAGLKAFCLTCPHEICQVDYVEDIGYVRVEEAAKPDHPLLVCPCHFSVFDPMADAARISGPASRGLYRFRLRVERDRVEITEVEEAVLRWSELDREPPRPDGVRDASM